MTKREGEEAAVAAPAEKPRRRAPPKPPSLRTVGSKGESAEAKRLAAVVLEVLAGARTPSAAALELGISLPRYYVLEARALEGLLRALEPRPRGPRRTLERERARLECELKRAERERARGEALLRAQRRALGLDPPPAAKKEPGKRRRRPSSRALRAAAVLRAEPRVLEEGGRKGEDGAA
jgi:hypothetical protein